jgi:Flp pilus assembly protein TadD
MNARKAALVGAVLVLAGGAAWWALQQSSVKGPASVAAAPSAAALEAVFIGSAGCAGCHAAEHAAWRGSQHQRAMQHASTATVLGDFDDARFSYAGTTSTFLQRDGRFYLRTDGPDGRLAEFEVKYTYGVEPLQQYLVELPGGRLQAVSVAWDSRPAEAGGQRWFHLYPEGDVDHRDELHWTRPAQNWNFMCADCHSTDVRKGYDPEAGNFRTEYSEVTVGCEACHGPGSAHAQWAQAGAQGADARLTVALDERRGIGWQVDPQRGQPQRSRPRTTEREIAVCAQCHARRAQIAEGYRAGKPFLDHYLPALLEPGLYHADGQQRDEVYVWGSWLQSRMHAAGVTCSDCHEPHTQQLRAPGNDVCAQCHAPTQYDSGAHHHHPSGSTGAECANCHMPRETYMVIDPRRDHSMRVPRPDQSVSFGVPNACSRCHREEDAAWAAARVREWLGRDAAGFETFASTFAAAAAGDPRATDGLAYIVTDAAQPPIVRASALVRLGATGPIAPELLARAARDSAPLLRLAAAQTAQAQPPDQRASTVEHLLADPLRAIRIEAARVLAGTTSSLAAAAPSAWQAAADEYLATLRYNADRPESRVALGGFEAARGRQQESLAAFEQAIALDPGFVPAYVNAADTLRAAGSDREAVAMLERGLAQVPDAAALHHSLGLAQVRLGQTDSALTHIRRAAQLQPDSARYTYVYAVALDSTGRGSEAIRVLQAALERWPRDRDLLLALASFQLKAGQRAGAGATAQRLIEAHPQDPQARALANELL